MVTLPRPSVLVCCSLLLLGGCGFHPMHGDYAANRARGGEISPLATVEVANLPDASGVFLRNALIDRFYDSGYPVNPRYTLRLSPVLEAKREMDITKSSEATRSQIVLSTDLVLTDREAPEKPALQRSLRTVSSYNVLESEFATRVTEQSARESGLNDLARQIELELSLFLNRAQQ